MKVCNPLKILLINVFILLFSFTALSQRISYGGKLGVSLCNQSGNPEFYNNTSFLTRYHVGGLINYPLSKQGFIQAEFLFSQKGYDYKLETSIDKEWQQGYFNYIDVPVTAKYLFGWKKYRFHINGGAYAGMLLNAKTDYKTSITTNVTKDIAEDYKGADIGLTTGGGFGIYNKKIVLFIETRYNFSLSNIDGTSDNLNIKNQFITVSVGFIYLD